ncbi:hypothetical protein DRH13_00235 [Candidatus Woesebacteria bacterium]|nr:MAG: hypothetical protein DRH13_00235 [Candidatus Woesebacteria bacterium]
MAFNVGDVVIINGMYSGQIIRANVERDMYVVKYRHPSESKPIKTMHRASELDLVRKSRSNPSCYPDDGVHSPPMADFRGWRITVSFLGESGIKYVDPKTKSYTSVPRFTAPPITDWLEVVAALDELENDPQISVLGDSLEVEEVADAPDVFLEGWYDPIFFQSYNDDGTQITNRSEWDLIGFLGPFPDGNVFVDGLLHLYDGNMRDYRFKTILSFDKQEYGSFVIGDKVSVLKTIAGRKMSGGSQRSGRHAFDIATREGSNRNWNYFTSEEDLQEYAEKYYLPHTLFQRKFSKCFLGYFRGAEMAGNFGQAFDHPMNNPFNTMSFSYLDLLGGYSSIYARMEKNIDDICNSMSKSSESSFRRPSPFVDDLIDDLEEALSLPADHPDYEESYHSKMLTGMLDEAIKTDAMARELGWIKKPGPKGRTEEDILRELRGENEWLAPYIERSKNKMNQNPSPLSPSQLKQKAALETQKQKVFGDSEISSVEDIIIEEMPSPTIPNFSVLFLTSPLKYKKYGPSVSPFRIALCDDRLEEPQSKKDMYFGDYEEWRTHSKRGYKRLKKPVLEQIIPGVGNDCIVAFLDYTTRGDNGFYIDYMRVRRGFEGQGIARALVESFYSEVAQDGDVVNWGKMMNEKVEHLMESMQVEFPHITSLGTPNF